MRRMTDVEESGKAAKAETPEVAQKAPFNCLMTGTMYW